jgi:hypothetical protein
MLRLQGNHYQYLLLLLQGSHYQYLLLLLRLQCSHHYQHL